MQLSLAATRSNGTPIGNGSVQQGETIILRSALIFVPYNWTDFSPSAAFSGGTMTINGVNVTPSTGVPTLGFPECGGEPFFSVRMPRLVTAADAAAGRIVASASYSNPGVGKATSVVLVRVRPSPALTASAQALRRQSIGRKSATKVRRAIAAKPFSWFR